MSLPAVAVAQTPENKLREFLASRPRPQRYTKQQRDILHHIQSSHSHFDADQLIDELKRAGSHISRATIYRTLSKFVDAGILRRLNVGARTFYEHDYGYPQHDHLYCQRCHKMIEFQDPALDNIIREVCRQDHFQEHSHTLIVRGLCSDCNRSMMTKRRLDLV